MIRGYLSAASLLALGLLGVGTLALQASGHLAGSSGARAGEPSDAQRAAQSKPPGQAVVEGPGGSLAPLRPTEPDRAASRLVSEPGADAGRPTPESGADGTRPTSEPGADGARPTPEPGADAPRPRPVSASIDGPPPIVGPKPTLTVEFERGSNRVEMATVRQVREMVDTHGYKDVRYEMVGYAADRENPGQNRVLANQRCQRVLRLFRKRGVSRRWLSCNDPVVPKAGLAQPLDEVPSAWRRVEVRLVK